MCDHLLGRWMRQSAARPSGTSWQRPRRLVSIRPVPCANMDHAIHAAAQAVRRCGHQCSFIAKPVPILTLVWKTGRKRSRSAALNFAGSRARHRRRLGRVESDGRELREILSTGTLARNQTGEHSGWHVRGDAVPNRINIVAARLAVRGLSSWTDVAPRSLCFAAAPR